MSSKPNSTIQNKIHHKNVRVAVINTLLSIQQGQSLSSLLDPLLNSLHGDDKGFAHALLLTTLRHWHATARLLDSLADNPIDEVEVRTTIQLGITQLLYLNVADHAAIHETVEAVKHIDFARASGLVNAVLRKVAKNPNKFRKKANKNHSLPNWLAQQLKADWREHYDELTQSLRQSAPMFLRVNGLQSDSESYLGQLVEAEIAAELVSLQTSIKDGEAEEVVEVKQQLIELIDSVPVSRLPEFEEGIASVQDAHAQLAAPIIQSLLQNKLANSEASDSIRLLDACAAPGGKLAHWLELLGVQESEQMGLFHVKQADGQDNPISKVELTAIDNEAPRITRIFENLERLQLPAPIVNSKLHLDIECVDATTWQAKPAAKESDSGFDAILLDAPCTATGVIRRHPDITLLRTEEDVQHTAQLQQQILDNLWPQLKVGGYLLYVTCSILKQENVEQMQAFLTRHKDAVAVAFDNDQTNWGIEQEVGRQCLPVYKMTEALEPTAVDQDIEQQTTVPAVGGDGFYYAVLRKVSV
ncbi:transcription antitermination factor NusB [Psychrobacter phenylpyruvicus]|uniref:Ribosomal RNA small subunit methyltransferase B n=1 Tax=Psychrobacter phenylpyruvicus TaxID=29432 RepID=A0A379LNT4_9GAMM|nr:transcription antitermination factor NusB [Psychrobacter phenylpyruvicus]SUD92111.1 Ribosomal RNA small subunit methyltransferase B [Psychrobacter phenylpyruvicus]